MRMFRRASLRACIWVETYSLSEHCPDSREWVAGCQWSGTTGPSKSRKLPGKAPGWEGLIVLEKPEKARVAGGSPWERRLKGPGGAWLLGEGLMSCLGLWSFAPQVFDSMTSLSCAPSNIPVEFPTHLFNGLLSRWLFVICMLLFYLLLMISCFRKNTITTS